MEEREAKVRAVAVYVRLLRRELGNGTPPPLALRRVFDNIYPGAPREVWFRFLRTATPMARKITLAYEPPEHVLMIDGEHVIKVKGARDWYNWVDLISPEETAAIAAAIADLHYWAGLTVRQVSRVLDLPVTVVLHDLREAKQIARDSVQIQPGPIQHEQIDWQERAVFALREFWREFTTFR